MVVYVPESSILIMSVERLAISTSSSASQVLV